jgi:signal transduction histidine kinase
MSDAHIRFSPDMLRRLGEELNPNPDQGIVELIKNAYDADAQKCIVELMGTDSSGGTIRISDDGDGMDVDRIIDGWLVLGRSPKKALETTRLGRTPSGSKGLGRLAALRMGARAVLTTRPRENPSQEYALVIDWKAFDGVATVEDVTLGITRKLTHRPAVPGTEVSIESLRVPLGRMDVKRLARSMILLADPFGEDPTGFLPILTAPEYRDLERLVHTRYFTDADYHLKAVVDENGRCHATVADWRGECLFAADHAEITRVHHGEIYSCPSTRFDLWVFILSGLNFSTRTTTLGEVRSWLDAFGGVHLYHNGLRVSPYGNPGNDWLDINVRRAQSPEERPSTNTSIGRVHVNDPHEQLVQKTDRSGFIENDAYHSLREFCQDALEWMARRRLEIAEHRRQEARAQAPKRAQRSKMVVEKAISSATSNTRNQLRRAFDAYDRSRDREVKQLRQEIQLYRTLSTAGITAATFAHESSGNPIKVIYQAIGLIKRRGRKEFPEQYDEILATPVNAITRAVEGLSVLGNVTLSLIEYDKRRVGRVDVHRVIGGTIDTFHPFLEGRDVVLVLELCAGAPYLHGSEAAVESIITNLLNNSLAAFERSKPGLTRTIRIRTALIEGSIVISVSDTGPGIRGISTKDIWLPGQTTRPNGTGLGLTIVRDAAKDLGGRVDALPEGDLGGADFVIELPILGA